jgi:hypothetical protein
VFLFAGKPDLRRLAERLSAMVVLVLSAEKFWQKGLTGFFFGFVSWLL